MSGSFVVLPPLVTPSASSSLRKMVINYIIKNKECNVSVEYVDESDSGVDVSSGSESEDDDEE